MLKKQEKKNKNQIGHTHKMIFLYLLSLAVIVFQIVCYILYYLPLYSFFFY